YYRRRQGTQEGGQSDQPEAQNQVPADVLRPGGGGAGNRHGSDQGQAQKDTLDLVGVEPGAHHRSRPEDEDDRDQQVGRQAGQQHQPEARQALQPRGLDPQAGVQQQQGEHEHGQGDPGLLLEEADL